MMCAAQVIPRGHPELPNRIACYPMNDARILVVDDEPQIRRTLRATLSNAGYEVIDAKDGILEGPGTIAVNAGLSKTTTLHERLKLRFEATFTNVLNHTNFAAPATNVSSPSTFGVLQSAQNAENGGNRTGQLALRLDF